jgi:hypothetical protein
MSKVTLVKKESIEEAQVFLNGGLIGGDASQGIEGLIGKTLIFTAPAAGTVTFALGSGSNPWKLSFKEIKQQIEAAVGLSGLNVSSIRGALVIQEDTTTSGVAITGAGTANAILGFDSAGQTGRVINAPGGAAPKLSLFTVTPDNRIVLAISEA